MTDKQLGALELNVQSKMHVHLHFITPLNEAYPLRIEMARDDAYLLVSGSVLYLTG